MEPTHPNDAHDSAVAEPLLRLELFGQMQAVDASGQSVLPRSRKTRAVLALLALAAPRPVPRARLAGLLWSQRGREQARGSLRQSVHELQRALGPIAGALLQPTRNHLALSDRGLWVDDGVARAKATSPAGPQVFPLILLDDLDGLDPAFDNWLAEQRQRVAKLAVSTAEAALAAESGTEARLAAAERLLAIDWTHEAAWRAVIRVRLEQGDRAAARSAFEHCATALSSAGVVPSRETEALMRGTPCQGRRSMVWPPRRLAFASCRRGHWTALE